MSIQIKHSSSSIGDGRWKWAVWLVGETSELDAIDHIVYTLHPTFPNPVRESRARRSGFRLTASGWGEFRIFIDIVKRTGEHQQFGHDLTLADDAGTETEDIDEDESEIAPLHQTILRNAGVKALLRSAAETLVAQVAEHLPTITAFVSGGVADTEAVSKLRASLKQLNVRILSTDEAPSGVPAQAWIPRVIAEADIAVFLISGRPSLWLSQEIDAAIRADKRIVPVLIGSEARLPEALSTQGSLHIENLDNLADLAGRILGSTERKPDIPLASP